MQSKTPKLVVLLLILILSVPLFLAPSGAAPSAAARTGEVATASDSVSSKIHPSLRAAVAAAAPGEAFDVIVYAKAGTDLSRYLSNLLVRKFVLPNGTQTYFGKVKAAQVSKLASLPEVAAVQELRYSGDIPVIPDLGPKRLNAVGVADARARIAELKAQAGQVGPRAAADKARIADWFDVLDVHKSKAAWELGYTGAGVKVMVNDSGIDFSHPDLIGTVARITDPDSPYYGWPEVFDAFSMLNLAYEYYLGIPYISGGVGLFGLAPDYVDTSATRSDGDLVDNGDGTYSAIFAPIGSTDPGGHVYTFPATSKSGVYHFGSHPDTSLEEAFGERVAVLVVDENEPGVYDTVYVDLDADYNFVNEKKAVKGDEYVYADLNADGYPDLSGGIIYWISDGVNPLPASDWMWGIGADVAGPGDLVAFAINDWMESGGDHGTLCASGVAAQGVIDGGSPAFKPAGDGTPGTGMVQGGGKDVKLTANGNMYTYASADSDGLIFAALGYDGVVGTDDDIQIVSNSFGSSSIVNDGWDYTSRLYDLILRFLNPYLTEANSTGNGGAGYGTSNSPGANLSIAVGASTLYDSTGANFDSIATQDQLLYNDLMTFSDRGPTAQGEVGVAVLANGAWGAGDLPLNEALLQFGVDGWNAWELWGGTSRSTPVAVGNLALAMQAFKEKNGRWPTNVEARALLMAGADTTHNDGFTEGAGTVNAERSVKIAAGLGGLYVLPDSVTFGDYRGTKYAAFTSIMHPGQTAKETFTIYNPGATDVTVTISDDHLVRFGQKEFDFTTVDQRLETPNFLVPDYLIDIEPFIPAGTELLEIKVVHPFAEFDPDGNYAANSRWRVVPLDWTDLNGDGKLFEDKNGNGAINCPGADFASPACEIQQGEYMRFVYGYNTGTSNQARVKMPLERKHDGIFLGLSHRTRSTTVPVTHMKIQLNFYKAMDFPWLTAPTSVTVPAGGMATFEATMAVPALANVGLYQAALRLNDGTNVTSIPVVANVAAFSTDFLFGGPPDAKTPYDNGQVYGYFDWTWRAESGDWRFYFMDVPDSTPEGASLLIDTRWTGANTDIDTLVMGPTPDCFSNGVGCEAPFSTFPGAQFVYGPYTLSPVGGSPRLNPRNGIWLYDTATGGPREIVAAPVTSGLNLVALHNVMFDGAEPEERFQGQVGTIMSMPNAVDLFVGNATAGSFPMAIQSSLPLAGLSASSFGLGVPETQTLPQIQDDPNDPSTASYKFPITIQDGALLEVTTSAAAGDIDLFLLYDFNNDGNFDFNNEVIGSSTTSTANEYVKVTFPPDGNYLAAVHGWGVAAGQTFDITINAVQGKDLAIVGLPSGPFQPNTPINFVVNWTLAEPLAVGGEAFGLILAGPPGAPAALQVPVRLHNITTGTNTVELPAIADTYLAKGQPNTNFGNDGYLYIGGNDILRSVLKFDVSSIAPNPVVSAKLYVYYDAFSGGGTAHALRAYDVTTPWAEGTATWNTPWSVPGGDYVEPAAASVDIANDTGTWKVLDVTALVQRWVTDPATNNGVMLRARNVTSYTVFRFPSSENWNPAEAPKLVVTYGVP